MYEEILTTAVTAAKEAGDLIRAGRATGQFTQHAKGPRNYYTSTDLAAERAIVKTIRSRFPDHNIVGEEGTEASSGTDTGDPVWIVDPIDGTCNFMRGLPAVAVSIAWSMNGQLTVGVVHAPFLDITYCGRRGLGATLNGATMKKLGDGTPTDGNCDDTALLAEALISFGQPYDRSHWEQVVGNPLTRIAPLTLDLRRAGCCSLDLCDVARGATDAYFEWGLSPWDVAGGFVILKECGGVVHDLSPEDLPQHRRRFLGVPDEALVLHPLCGRPEIVRALLKYLTPMAS